MKKTKAIACLDREFKLFCEALAHLGFYSKFIIYEAKHAVNLLQEGIKNVEKLRQRKNIKGPLMGLWSALLVRDLTAPEYSHFPVSSEGAEEQQLLECLAENINAQHQWLLVKSYEEFERYVKNFYGSLGFLDRNIWHASDFGNISLSEICLKTEDWFQDQVEHTLGKHNIRPILNVLRNRIPRIDQFETSNNRQCNLRLLTGMTETFRHVIVHSSGQIELDELDKAVSKATGISLSGSSPSVKQNLTLIRSFVDVVDNDIVKVQLIAQDNLKPPFLDVNMPFLRLHQALVDHGGLLYAEAIRRFGHEPYWLRNV